MSKDEVSRAILLFSGKRKSGKDYITEILHQKLGSAISRILRLSGPLKKQYAIEHNLDFSRLLDSSEYKERYRADMITWGEAKRNSDHGYFCRIVTNGPGSETPVWIISDARRKTDIQYFREDFDASNLVLSIRVQSSDAVRETRGWVYTTGVDDVESECDLDGEAFDLVVENNGDEVKLEAELNKLCEIVREKLGIS